jgi:hypothetical protein
MALEVHLLWHARNNSCSFCESTLFDEETVRERDDGGTLGTRGGPDRIDGVLDKLIKASDLGADFSVIEGVELELSEESFSPCIDSPSRHDNSTKSIDKIIEKINSNENDIFILKN